jgi:hypothetical protein
MKAKKFRLLATVALICCLFAATSTTTVEVKEGKVWLGIGYLAAKRGASAEAGVALGAVGLLHSTVHSIAWGAALGGPAGAAAGLVVGV